MGRHIAERGIQLVYGAGKTGLMGAVADGVLAAGGQVIGVVPRSLNSPALIHANLTRLEVVDDIHTRKARMNALADALIALPGGYGTFDELFEALTWAQIGLQLKPIGLLNIRGYFNPVMALIEHALHTYERGDLDLYPRPDPERLRMKLYRSSDSPRFSSKPKKSARRNHPKAGWRVITTWRGFPHALKQELSALASDAGLNVPVGELITTLLRYGLQAYEAGHLQLDPVPEVGTRTLFPEGKS